VEVARRLLGAEGPDALTMRRIASELGIKAPSLYKHFPDKRALEAAVIAQGLREFGAAMSAALAGRGEPVKAMATAYRAFGLEHPHIYRLMNDGPLPRDLLPAGLEDDVSRPLVTVFGDRARARVAWATAHGLVSLELAGRFPEDADLDAAWDSAVRTLRVSAAGSPKKPARRPTAARHGTRRGPSRRRRT
jgi:AcrR family transcriptional regulator